MFLFIKFIGVTLVNNIILISSVKCYNTLSVYHIMCSPPELLEWIQVNEILYLAEGIGTVIFEMIFSIML